MYLLHVINSCVSLQAGLVLPGFIRKTMAYGCFVELPNNLSGLAPTKYLSDGLFVSIFFPSFSGRRMVASY